jgi:hypothetical protein
MRIRIRDPGIFLTLDPGWKIFGSGINIPDPQHWFLNEDLNCPHTQARVAELKQSFGDTKPAPVKLEPGTAIKMEDTAIKMEGTAIKMEGVKSEPGTSTSTQGEPTEELGSVV